jgi:guanosine-3',5'-bis(diphosphate) 3'-pyrophosphohydrolase
LSDDKSLWKDERKRIEVEHAPKLSPKAKLIKLADKTSNVADLLTNPPPDWTLQRRRDYVDFAEAVAAGCRGLNVALDADFDRIAAAVRAKIG